MTELIRRKNTGEAWETVVDTGGGGSQPGAAVWKDLGLIDVTDLLENGATLVYTPAGEYVTAGTFAVVAFLDAGYRVDVGVISQMGNDPWDALTIYDTDTVFVTSNASNFGQGPYTVPLYAAYLGNSTAQPVVGPAGSWQALHAYAEGDCIIDSDGYLERCTTAGTSGAMEPTWPDNSGDTTSDGTAEWTNEDIAPTSGSARLLIQVTTPEAP